MPMGETGTINMTPDMFSNAKTVVSEYRKEVAALASQLEAEMSSLIPGNFSGSAANGFQAFYESKIVPANGESMTKVLDAIDSMLDGIFKAIPAESEGVDDQLGEGNKGV